MIGTTSIEMHQSQQTTMIYNAVPQPVDPIAWRRLALSSRNVAFHIKWPCREITEQTYNIINLVQSVRLQVSNYSQLSDYDCTEWLVKYKAANAAITFEEIVMVMIKGKITQFQTTLTQNVPRVVAYKVIVCILEYGLRARF